MGSEGDRFFLQMLARLLRALFLIRPCLACEDLNKHGRGCWQLVAASLVGP